MNPSSKPIRRLSLLLCFSLIFIQLSTVLSVQAVERTSFFEERDVIFLGDSTTNSFRHHGVLKDGKNTTRVWCGAQNTLSMWGLASKKIKVTRTMKEELLAIPDSEAFLSEMSENPAEPGTFLLPIASLLALRRPACLVITLGINGCVLMEKEAFAKEYCDLIELVRRTSPTTLVVLNSIFPVREGGKVSNQEIDETNRLIHEIAKDRGVYFIDTNAALKAESTPYTEWIGDGDGIHWTKKGCERILDLLASLLDVTIPPKIKQPRGEL